MKFAPKTITRREQLVQWIYRIRTVLGYDATIVDPSTTEASLETAVRELVKTYEMSRCPKTPAMDALCEEAMTSLSGAKSASASMPDAATIDAWWREANAMTLREAAQHVVRRAVEWTRSQDEFR